MLQEYTPTKPLTSPRDPTTEAGMITKKEKCKKKKNRKKLHSGTTLPSYRSKE